MIQRELLEAMERILPSRQIKCQEPMDRHCSFRTGGPADALVLVKTEKEMEGLLSLLKEAGEEYFLLGRGTNLLIGDGGYRGVIVTAAPPASAPSSAEAVREAESGEWKEAREQGNFPLDAVYVDGNRVIAGAGATLKAAAIAAMENGLAGMEFAAGIPGTVGGGLVMNAGAYGGEMKNIVESVRLLMPDGSLSVFT